jgi:hypothetical protein
MRLVIVILAAAALSAQDAPAPVPDADFARDVHAAIDAHCDSRPPVF